MLLLCSNARRLRGPAPPLAILLAGLAACGGGSLALPNEGQPSEITVVGGNQQSGTTGEPLGDSLVVRVVDRLGDPVVGAEVTWTAEVGGSVSPATSVTSSTGQAIRGRRGNAKHQRLALGRESNQAVAA